MFPSRFSILRLTCLVHTQSSFLNRASASSRDGVGNVTTANAGSGNGRYYIFGRDDSNSGMGVDRQERPEGEGEKVSCNGRFNLEDWFKLSRELHKLLVSWLVCQSWCQWGIQPQGADRRGGKISRMDSACDFGAYDRLSSSFSQSRDLKVGLTEMSNPTANGG